VNGNESIDDEKSEQKGDARKLADASVELAQRASGLQRRDDQFRNFEVLPRDYGAGVGKGSRCRIAGVTAMQIKIENIIVPKGRRPLDQTKVEEIAESIKLVGLLSPIGVRSLDSKTVDSTEGKVELVFGAHRLAAYQRLGQESIEVVEVDSQLGVGDDDDTFAKLAEVAENLHRADLTIQQRNEHLAQWVALREKFGVPISDAERPISKPGRKPSPAVAAAARMSGLTIKTVKEAIKTTKVSPEVKAAADKAELTAKQRLAVARLATEAEQLDAVSKQAATNSKTDHAEKTRTKPDDSGPAESLETLIVKRSSAAALARISDDKRVELLAELVQSNDWLNKTAIDIAISGGANRGKLAPPNLRYEALSFMREAIARIEAELAGRPGRESSS
jgi:ParB/RepB/Spo0J family partition protein